MEEWPVDALHHRRLAPIAVCLAVLEIARQLVVRRAAVVGRRFDIDSGGLALGHVSFVLESLLDVTLDGVLMGMLIVDHLRMSRSRCSSFDLSHTEDWLPPVEPIIRGRCRVAETCGRQCSFRPAVVDMSEVPLNSARRSIEIELVANIDQVLDRSHINIVNR